MEIRLITIEIAFMWIRKCNVYIQFNFFIVELCHISHSCLCWKNILVRQYFCIWVAYNIIDIAKQICISLSILNVPTQFLHDFLHTLRTIIFSFQGLRVFLHVTSRDPFNFHPHFLLASFGHENFLLHAAVIVDGNLSLVFLPQAFQY